MNMGPTASRIQRSGDGGASASAGSDRDRARRGLSADTDSDPRALQSKRAGIVEGEQCGEGGAPYSCSEPYRDFPNALGLRRRRAKPWQ